MLPLLFMCVTFQVEVLPLLFVWVLPFQLWFGMWFIFPIQWFWVVWCLRFECISILCCYAVRMSTCKVGVATVIVLYRSRFRNGSVWVLQWRWLLFRIGCMVMDPCTSKLRDVISGGSKSSALLEYTWMHVILVETVDVGVSLYRVLKCEISPLWLPGWEACGHVWHQLNYCLFLKWLCR